MKSFFDFSEENEMTEVRSVCEQCKIEVPRGLNFELMTKHIVQHLDDFRFECTGNIESAIKAYIAGWKDQAGPQPKKNCYNCKFCDWADGDISDSDGWVCERKDFSFTQEEEMFKKMGSDEYKNRAKRCCELDDEEEQR